MQDKLFCLPKCQRMELISWKCCLMSINSVSFKRFIDKNDLLFAYSWTSAGWCQSHDLPLPLISLNCSFCLFTGIDFICCWILIKSIFFDLHSRFDKQTVWSAHGHDRPITVVFKFCRLTATIHFGLTDLFFGNDIRLCPYTREFNSNPLFTRSTLLLIITSHVTTTT